MRDMLLDETSYGKSNGIGRDLGVIIKPSKNVKMGLGIYDIGGTSVSYKDRTEETILGQAFR